MSGLLDVLRQIESAPEKIKRKDSAKKQARKLTQELYHFWLGVDKKSIPERWQKAIRKIDKLGYGP